MMNLSKYLAVIAILLLCTFQSTAQTLTDSDIKKNVAPIDNSLQRITALEPKSFEFDTDQYRDLKLPQGARYGFISEEFASVFPLLVDTKSRSFMQGKNTYKWANYHTIDLEGLVPVLVASIKEQQKQIEKLQQDVADLQRKLSNP